MAAGRYPGSTAFLAARMSAVSPSRSRAFRLCYALWRIAMLCFAYALLVEPALVVRSEHRIAANLGPGCDGLRVAIVGDLHVGDYHVNAWRRLRLVRDIQAFEPDLILLPGDFHSMIVLDPNYTSEEIAAWITSITELAPSYAVLGNHDIEQGAPDVISRGLASRGMHVLNNAHASIPLRGGQCQAQVIGIGDYFSSMHQVEKALADLPSDADVLLAVTHDPQVAPKLPGALALLAAGHTHGGVVCVPGTLACASRFHSWTGGWVRGLYEGPGSVPVVVTSGLGNTAIPLRFGAPPGWDAVVLTGRADAALGQD